MNRLPLKSAINEARDQMLLDRADGKYLSNLTANLNFERPLLWFSNDNLWRALVRRAALDYRQVSNLFRDYLTLIFGPQKTVYTMLAGPLVSTDQELTVLDYERIPQLGTMVIDEGLATKETIAYTFRDPRNGLVSLASQATKDHLAGAANASGTLKVNANIGATTLSLWDSWQFPTSGFPYTLILDPGTDQEEVVTLTGHTLGLNQLTVNPSLTKSHLAPQPTPIVSSLTNTAASNTVLRLQDSSCFPASGYIKLLKNDGLTTSEVGYYTSNDIENNTLYLRWGLSTTFPIVAPGTTVTLLEPGATVALAQVQVKGVDWDVFVTSPKEVKIYIPRAFSRHRMQDAGWLHHDGTISASSTVGAGMGAVIGDTEIKLTSGGATNFPSSGLIKIEPGSGDEEVTTYVRHDANSFTQLMPSVTSPYVGSSKIQTAIDLPMERKSFCAAGRWWAFYNDGYNIVYRSTDGSQWSEVLTFKAGVDSGWKCSVWYDQTYLYIATSDETTEMYFRRGTPNSDGSITWSAEQLISGVFKGISLMADSGKYPYIGYTGTDDRPYVTKSSTNDGTWTTAGSFPYQLSTTVDSSWAVFVAPLTSSRMLAVYSRDGQRALYQPYNGSAWETDGLTANVVSVSNIASLSGLPTIDSVLLTDSQVVLLTAQSTASQNGLWAVHTTAWTRPGNFAAGAHAAYIMVRVSSGTTYGGTRWVCTTAAPNDVIGTHSLAFSQTQLQDYATLVALTTGYQLSITNESDAVHLAYRSSAGNLLYRKFTLNAGTLAPPQQYGSWSTEATIQAGVDTGTCPQLVCLSSVSKLYCFWSKDDGHIYYNLRSSGTWGTTTDWIDTSANQIMVDPSAISVPPAGTNQQFGVFYTVQGRGAYSTDGLWTEARALSDASLTKSVTEIRVLTSGIGYVTPLVSFTGGGGGVDAAATAVKDGAGRITKITITNAGTGYTEAPGVVITDDGGGPGVDATAEASISFYDEITVDDVSLVEGDQILLIDQDISADNGVWTVHNDAAWVRPDSFGVGLSAKDSSVWVTEGTVYALTGWACTTDSIIGTNDLIFKRFYNVLLSIFDQPQIPVGTSVLYVECAGILQVFDFYNKFHKLYLDRGDSANAEIVTYSEINTENNTITLESPTTKPHNGTDPVHPFTWPDTLYLNKPLTKAHPAGVTVEYHRPVWASTTLHDGSIFSATRFLFQGPRLIDLGVSIPRCITTTLAESVAGPTKLAATQFQHYMTLEVEDALLFNNNGVFSVHIRGGGSDQIIDTVKVVLQASVSGLTLSAGSAVGDFSIQVLDAVALPQPSDDPYGYRLLIGKGTANAEVVIVKSISHGASFDTIYTVAKLTKTHSPGATVELMADVIVLADPVGYEFPGFVPKLQLGLVNPGPLTPYTQVSVVHELRTYIEIDSVTGFTAGEDKVILAFGYDHAEELKYDGTGTGPARLLFPDGVELSGSHALGETVHLSGITSHSDKLGTDRVGYVPASMEERLKYLFDRGRAAGVKITVIDSR